MRISRTLTTALAALAFASVASAQDLRVFPLSAATPPIVHWDATSNLGPMGAFNQSYPLGGDLVFRFDVSPAIGRARLVDARFLVPNSVVAVLMGGPGVGTVAFRDLELGATSPDFLILPAFPGSVYATTLDLVVKSGAMTVSPPFGPAFDVDLAGTALGSLPVNGSFVTIGPAQGVTVSGFSFDMLFSAAGWNGSFTHNVPPLTAAQGCPAPASYCPSDPNTFGGGTEMILVGSTSVAADDFRLSVTRAPANTFGVFFYGLRRDYRFSGHGTMCVGGPHARLGVVQTDAAGTSLFRVVLAAHQTGPLALEPGAHGHFQFFHRAISPVLFNWNFSNALAVTFCP